MNEIDKNLNFYKQQKRIDNLTHKLGIATLICANLMLDTSILLLVFSLCNITIGYIITFILNMIFIFATIFLVVFLDKLLSEKRLLKIEHQIEELQNKSEQNKERFEDKLHELDIRLEDLGG